ncbi:MAG: hypothetical protein GEU73_06450 [Chloroflexi bacterium]|nr:hypothetical protein [Chloroflexota bacterium]
MAYGYQHLQRPVTWARAFVNRPWALGGIEEGALVILSLRGLTARSEVQALPRLVDALITARVSAICLTDDSTEVVEAGARADALPIMVLPPDSSPQDAERAIIGLIVDRDGQVQRRAAEIYQSLIQLALEDAPTDTMAGRLADAAGRVVYLEDEYGVLQAVAGPTESDVQGLPTVEEAPGIYTAREVLGISPAAPVATSPPAGTIRRVLGSDGYGVCSAPISIGGTVAGFLTLLGRAEEMHELDDQIALRAASAFAVPIAKYRAVMETQTRLQGSFLENLLAGTFTDDEEIEARARYLGHDLGEPYETACLTIDDQTDRRQPLFEGQQAGLWTSFLDLARRELRERWPRALLRERGDVLAMVLPAGDVSSARDLRGRLEEVRVRLGALVGGASTTVGMGRHAAGPRAIVRSYAEAEQAARIGRQFLGGNRTVTFEELGVYRVIAGVESREVLEAFRREYLGAVEDYDARHGAELTATLEGFFACNGNHARAAEMLHLHRNTLLYRLERVEALGGRNLDDAETRLSMQLALKIRRVFPTIVVSQIRSTRGGQR